MRTFILRERQVQAEDLVDGFLVDPVLPRNFDDTDNRKRSGVHMLWWDIPYVRTYRDSSPEFLKRFPEGVRFDVRCLDGGAWDRSTWWGSYSSLPEAVKRAKEGPSHRIGIIEVQDLGSIPSESKAPDVIR